MDGEHVEKCVLFADVAGSTRMYGEHGDDATHELLKDCLDLMEGVVDRHDGHVARRIGDELLCTFPAANDAAMAAMKLQEEVSRADFRSPVRLRIGFEQGPIIETPEALYGNTVHAAARVAARAKAGQILTTKRTLELLNPALRCFCRYFDSVLFKGLAGEFEIHELVWNLTDATCAARPPGRPRSAAPAGAGCVELEYGGSTFRVDVDRPRLEIGRDLSCDLRVEGTTVSNLHARVLWERGTIRVEDVSTNGTVIERDGGKLPLHHGHASLLGSGTLYLGTEGEGATIRFRCG